jgi:branched-chain amino acid transport system substrate-binding protein
MLPFSSSPALSSSQKLFPEVTSAGRRRFVAACVLASLWPHSSAQVRAPIPGVTPGTLTLAHFGPLSGILAPANAEALSGAQYYFDALNQEGGVNGRRILLRIEDDKQDAKLNAEMVKKAIEDNSVFGLFMYRTTPAIEAVIPLITEASMPMLAPQVGPNSLYEPFNRNIFPIRARYRDEAIELLRHLNTIQTKRIGFVFATDTFGKDVKVGVDGELQRLGLKPAFETPVDNRTPDVLPAIAAILESMPQAVVIITGFKPASDIIKAVRAKGGKMQFFTLSNNSSDAFIKALGNEPRNVGVTQVIPSPTSRGGRFGREYAAAVAKSNGKLAISYAAAQGYLSAMIVSDGLRRAGRDLSRDSFSKSMESISKADFLGYQIRYSADSHQGSRFTELTMIGRDGRFVR